MLRRLALQDPVGCLRPKSLPPEVVFGRHTVVYGHNGSGKSTLAELLGALGSGDHDGTATWHAPDGTEHRVLPGDSPPGIHVSAFTASWVRANLSSFLSGEGEGAKAIVTLGSKSIDAASEIEAGEQRVVDLVRRQGEIETEVKEIDAETNEDCRRIQDEIFSALHGENRYFSRNKFTVPRIGLLLGQHEGDPTSDLEHERLLNEARRRGMEPLAPPARPSVDWADLHSRLHHLVSTTPSSLLLDDLTGHPRTQQWAADGIELHASRDRCLFCDSTVSAERRAALDLHFDESRARIVDEVRTVRAEMTRLREEHQVCIAGMPVPEDVYPETLKGRENLFERSLQHLHDVVGHLDTSDEILFTKEVAPETTPGPLPIIPAEESGDDLTALVDDHNEIVGGHATRQRECCDAALVSMVGRRAGAHETLRKRRETLSDELTDVRDELRTTSERVQDLRAQRFTSREMAERLTQDLSRVYGKRHLAVGLTSEGTSYTCTRDGRPAVNLSEGERRTLALLYFLRALEDTSPPIDPLRRLVVVDDPSSSLDRECVFGTHDWLRKSLQPYGQSIVLTHDFELLRMLINSGRGDVRKFSKWIMADQRTRAPQPEMAFLEISASATGAGRTSHLANISKVVLEHPSEYHFLFDRVAAGVDGSADYDVLFLLPNAARRLLETFASFRVPDEHKHYRRMKKLCDEHEGADFQDVYDFCNRFSHGEDRQVAEPLEARVVLREITRCMEFIRAVDQPHYLAMMRATGHGDGVIFLPDSTSAGDRDGAPAAMSRGVPGR